LGNKILERGKRTIKSPLNISTFYLHAYVSPEEATHDKINWVVNDSSILSTFEPNSDGSSIFIKAKEAGNIVVTANVGDISNSITLMFINKE